MALVELVMPKMGESIIEATVLQWLKKPGDSVEQDESLLEVATDKVDTEVPSTHSGILKEILAKEGEVVKVGKTIALISSEADAEEGILTPAAGAKNSDSPKQASPATSNGSNGFNAAADYKSTARFYSPLVKNIAREENIPVAELENIPGSGAEGRVTKKDILGYVQLRKSGSKALPVQQQAGAYIPKAPVRVPPSISGADEIIEMDRMRKMIAERMVDSKRISPHVTSFVEADVTNIVLWRNKVKNEFQKREGDTLTFTPIFVEAVALAIKDYPMINIQVDGDRIIRKRDINVGIAVALPSGNLIVPVIRNADQFSITGLAKMVNDLARRARENIENDQLIGAQRSVAALVRVAGLFAAGDDGIRRRAADPQNGRVNFGPENFGSERLSAPAQRTLGANFCGSQHFNPARHTGFGNRQRGAQEFQFGLGFALALGPEKSGLRDQLDARLLQVRGQAQGERSRHRGASDFPSTEESRGVFGEAGILFLQTLG